MQPIKDSFLHQIKQELNPVQYDAVTHTDSPLLVLAGAGSGKTRVITYRIAYLISVMGFSPWNILALTFTNKAAAEMRERVSKILNGDPKGLWIGTFHAICARILRNDGKAIGIKPDFVIYDTSDQIAAIKQAMSICDISKQEIKPKAASGYISRAKSNFEFPDQMAINAKEYAQQLAARIYKQYQSILSTNNALDFDDLLMYCVHLLIEKPDVLLGYQKRFKHVLVDEYQDTNHPQYLMLKSIAQAHQNICAVGDDDQSIYSWRGADIRNILDFERDFNQVKVVRLEQNYRSTKTILAAASQLVAKNKQRHEKTIWCENDQGKKLGLVRLPDQNSEAYWVCQKIQKLHDEEKVDYKDNAIFYRTNAQSRSFEEELIRLGIPYTIVGGTAFYERKEIKDILAYARLLVNPADMVSFQRIINVPKRKLGAQSQAKLFEFTERIREPILDAAYRVQEAGDASGMKAVTRNAFYQFALQFKHWHEVSKKLSLVQLMERILLDSGYQTMLKADKDPQSEARLDNITELINAAGDFEEEYKKELTTPVNTIMLLQAFLENITLVSQVDQVDEENNDQVIVMTLHGAKGLEFPYVYMTGMEEGLLPHANSLNNERNLEEERRLCYVGITRAKKELYLTYAESRRTYNKIEYTLPSRFLDEIPKECIERISWGQIYGGEKMEMAAFEDGPPNTRHEIIEFTEGDMVTHRSFGFGVVLDVDGKPGKSRITVDFQDFGQKILAQEYAKLEKV